MKLGLGTYLDNWREGELWFLMDNHKDGTLVFGSNSVYVDKRQHFQLHRHAIEKIDIDEHEGVDDDV